MPTYKDPLVRQSGGRLITTSLAVSQHFGKRHKHVLASIESLECSEDFRGTNFRPSSYTTQQGKHLPSYEITRDGFMFLCMGFTGKAAAVWKERYIAAFNALEHQAQAGMEIPAYIRKELTLARPLWAKIQRYKRLGLNHREIGDLVGRSPGTVRCHVRRMELCGVLQAPANLPQMQQLALPLRGGV